jgi:hypothetical protein
MVFSREINMLGVYDIWREFQIQLFGYCIVNQGSSFLK